MHVLPTTAALIAAHLAPMALHFYRLRVGHQVATRKLLLWR